MADETNDDDKHRLISLTDAAELYGFSANILTNLQGKGRLKAQKIGDLWVVQHRKMLRTIFGADIKFD